jgi:hypothetical protein
MHVVQYRLFRYFLQRIQAYAIILSAMGLMIYRIIYEINPSMQVVNMNEASDTKIKSITIHAEFQIFLEETSSQNPFDIIITQETINNVSHRIVLTLQDIIDRKIEQLDASRMTDEEYEKFMSLVNYFVSLSQSLNQALRRSRKIYENRDERDSTLW